MAKGLLNKDSFINRAFYRSFEYGISQRVPYLSDDTTQFIYELLSRVEIEMPGRVLIATDLDSSIAKVIPDELDHIVRTTNDVSLLINKTSVDTVLAQDHLSTVLKFANNLSDSTLSDHIFDFNDLINYSLEITGKGHLKLLIKNY